MLAPIQMISSRVVVADEQTFVREGVRALLELHRGFVVVGEALNGDEALDRCHELLPDILITKAELPGMDGLALSQAITSEMPELKVLLFTAYSGKFSTESIFRAGARGCLNMDAHPEELVRALTTIQAGNLYIGTGTRPPPAAAATDNQTSTGLCSELSLLQRRVLELLANGFRNKDIAEALGTTIRTVENQREALMRRLGIKSVAGLTKHAIRTGVTSLNERLVPFPGPYSGSREAA